SFPFKEVQLRSRDAVYWRCGARDDRSRGRFIHLDGPSGRTRHLNREGNSPTNANGSEFPELVAENSRTHKHGGKPATLRVNQGGAVLASDGNEILGCVGKNSD